MFFEKKLSGAVSLLLEEIFDKFFFRRWPRPNLVWCPKQLLPATKVTGAFEISKWVLGGKWHQWRFSGKFLGWVEVHKFSKSMELRLWGMVRNTMFEKRVTTAMVFSSLMPFGRQERGRYLCLDPNPNSNTWKIGFNNMPTSHFVWYLTILIRLGGLWFWEIWESFLKLRRTCSRFFVIHRYLAEKNDQSLELENHGDAVLGYSCWTCDNRIVVGLFWAKASKFGVLCFCLRSCLVFQSSFFW